MVRPLTMLVLASLLLCNSAEGPVKASKSVVIAVASDLSTQEMEFQLERPSESFSTDTPRHVDSPEVLGHPCSECDWQIEVQINETTVLVITERSLFISSASVGGAAEVHVVPFPDCNVTSTIHEDNRQSVVVLCDHSHSNTLPKLYRYNYTSGVLSDAITLSSPTDPALGRGALFGLTSKDDGAVVTRAVFPEVDEPWILQAFDIETGFSWSIEVFPVECSAVQQATVVDYAGKNFLLLHCSTGNSNEISLLVFADLAEDDDSPIYFDLQTESVSYSPYTAVVRCSSSAGFCVIALHDSPRIVVLDLHSSTFRTLSLTNIAQDAVFLESGYVVYSSSGGLYSFSPVELFSDNGPSHVPEFVSGSAGTCFPPDCPKLQVINGSFVLSTKRHHDNAHSAVVYACGGEVVLFEGSVEVEISPSWYLPFVEQEEWDPSSSVSPQTTTYRPSILPELSGETAPSNQPFRADVVVSVAVVILGIAVFVVVASIILVATAIRRARKRRSKELELPTPIQPEEEKETPEVIAVPVIDGQCYRTTYRHK